MTSTLIAWATVAVIGTLLVRALPEAIRYAREQRQADQERAHHALTNARRELEAIRADLNSQHHGGGSRGGEHAGPR